MSNAERKANLPAIIKTCEPTFTELARRHQVPDFTFARESAYALQILNSNDYLATVACGNQDSLKEAIVHVAAIGLSLSPVHKQAYLVPRKKRVCLDISYQGLIDLTTSKGAILWAKAVLVYDNDRFEYRGVNQEPLHSFDPFRDRGSIVGAYCVAKMPTGDLLVDFMSIAEIFRIRDRSEGYKAFKSGTVKSTPWESDTEEMCKKTMIRRAYKSWPKTVARDVLDTAMKVIDESENALPDVEAEPSTESDPHRDEGIIIIRDLLQALERPEAAYVAHLSRANNRTITRLEDLTRTEVDQAVTFLQGLVDAQAAKLEKLRSKEKRDENAG